MNNPKSSLQSSLKSSSKRGFFDDLFGSDAGGTLGSARDLGTLKAGSSFKRSGTVGGSDLDFFKFKLERTTDFSAELNNRSNNSIALTILDRSGDSVTNRGRTLFKNVEGDDDQTLSTTSLPQGTYYARLQNANGNQDSYDLRLKGSVSSGSGNGGSGNGGSGSSDIRTLGNLSSSRTYQYSGVVGGSETDLYQFSVNNRSRFTTSLFNDGSNPIAVSVLDRSNRVVKTANGRFLFANIQAGRSRDLFAPTLASGNYSLRVQSAVGSQEDYQVSLRRSSSSLFS